MAKEHKEFLTGLNRLHVMHHAVQEELYGLCMMKELKRHGYRVSPGTLYPLLHVLQRNRLYPATKKGHEALNFAKDKVREVFGGTNRGTVMLRRPTVNCRPSDAPAGNPVGRNLRNHDSARVGKGTDRATRTVYHSGV